MNISNIFSKTSLVLLCSIVAVGARAFEKDIMSNKDKKSRDRVRLGTLAANILDDFRNKGLETINCDSKKMEINLEELEENPIDYDDPKFKDLVDCNDRSKNSSDEFFGEDEDSDVVMNVDTPPEIERILRKTKSVDDNKKDDERFSDSDDDDEDVMRKKMEKEFKKNTVAMNKIKIKKKNDNDDEFVDLTTKNDDKAIKEHKERRAKLQERMARLKKNTLSSKSVTSTKNKKKSSRRQESLISRNIIQKSLKQQEDPKPGWVRTGVKWLFGK